MFRKAAIFSMTTIFALGCETVGGDFSGYIYPDRESCVAGVLDYVENGQILSLSKDKKYKVEGLVSFGEGEKFFFCRKQTDENGKDYFLAGLFKNPRFGWDSVEILEVYTDVSTNHLIEANGTYYSLPQIERKIP